MVVERKTPAIIYCRFSSRPGAEVCQSNEVQADLCAEYCRAKGYVVEEVIKDRAVSGGDEERPELWRAISLLRRGSVLVALRPDRISRSVYLTEFLHRKVAKKKARIEYVTGGQDGEKPEEVMLRQLLSAFSEYERKMIASRISAALLHYQKQGRLVSSHAPYGWQEAPPVMVPGRNGKPKLERRIEPCPKEQAIIASIIAFRHAGFNYFKIARYLDAQGVKPRKGKRWRSERIQSILEREGADI